MSDLELVERLVADAFQSADPRAALRAAADAPGLSDDARARLRAAAPDGVRVAGLLIARFLMQLNLRSARSGQTSSN